MPYGEPPTPSGIRSLQALITSTASILEEIVDKTIYISTQVSGVPVTFVRPLDGGRTRGYLRVERVIDRYRLDEVLPPGCALHGVLVDPNGEAPAEFRVFDLYDVRQGCFVDLHFLRRFTDERALRMVPIEEILVCPNWTLAEWLQRAAITKKGIVVRPAVETLSWLFGGRLGFKVNAPLR